MQPYPVAEEEVVGGYPLIGKIDIDAENVVNKRGAKRVVWFVIVRGPLWVDVVEAVTQGGGMAYTWVCERRDQIVYWIVGVGVVWGSPPHREVLTVLQGREGLPGVVKLGPIWVGAELAREAALAIGNQPRVARGRAGAVVQRVHVRHVHDVCVDVG